MANLHTAECRRVVRRDKNVATVVPISSQLEAYRRNVKKCLCSCEDFANLAKLSIVVAFTASPDFHPDLRLKSANETVKLTDSCP